MSLGEDNPSSTPQNPNQPVHPWLALETRLAALSTNTTVLVLALILLVAQVEWGLWSSQDWPSVDEAWALTDGYRLAHGHLTIALSWWKSPLYRILYAASALVLRTISATFYGQRLALTVLAVLALYFLLRRVLPGPLAWLGAAWLAVSPVLIDLDLDRSDFLAAAICTWAALAILESRSARRFAAALGLAVVSFLFRPEYILVVAAVAGYGLALVAYRHLTQPKRTRLILIGAAGAILALMGAGAGLYILRTSPTVGGYFMWVFANNRTTTPANAPLWVAYEADYGPNRSITAVLTHPRALAHDVIANAGRMVQFTKAATTSTAWASAGLRVERWLAALGLLLLAAAIRMWRGWRPQWRTYWSVHGLGWLSLGLLLPLFTTNFVLAPLPVYLLIFLPVIFGGALLLMYASLRGVITVKPYFFPLMVVMVLILAPNARAFAGPQPLRRLVGYLQQAPSPGKPLSLLGTASPTICAYLGASGTPCVSDQWTDDTGYPTLDSLMQQSSYDYLIVDQNMAYLLTQPTGLSQVVAGSDARWQLVQVFGEYKVFKNVAGAS